MTETERILQEEYYSIKTETVEELRKVVDSIKKHHGTGNKDSELLSEIRKLEVELRNLKRAKRYGLLWEKKPEEFEEAAKNALPVLEEISELAISDGSDKPQNIIIEGDNYHSLAALSYTHKGQIDVIYIDPPYNTGNKDFVYNDRYVDKEDDFRHSKWLSFMAKRLEIARDLLKETGVIFISIDDNEQAQLKMLCDEVFKEQQFIANLIVQLNPRGRTLDKHFAKTHEYVLVYAKNFDSAEVVQIEKSEDKLGEYRLEDSEGRYRLLELRNRNPVFNRSNRPNLFYPLYVGPNGDVTTEQIDGYAEAFPRNSKNEDGCWTWSKDKVNKQTSDLFGKQTGGGVWRIFRKDRMIKNGNLATTKEKSIWLESAINNENGKELLRSIFGDTPFDYPKSTELIKRCITLTGKKDAIALDFFAGSGTTGQAILELNIEDDGNRRFILCSNRENNSENPDKNLCRDVCYKRIKHISEGYTNTRNEEIDALGGNVRYFKTGFVKHTKSTDNLRHAFVDRCSDLLRIKDDCFESVSGFDSVFRVFSGKDKNLAILFDPSRLSDLTDYLRSTPGKVSAYIFTIAPEPFVEELAEFSDRLTIEPIPDTILAAYRKIFRI